MDLPTIVQLRYLSPYCLTVQRDDEDGEVWGVPTIVEIRISSVTNCGGEGVYTVAKIYVLTLYMSSIMRHRKYRVQTVVDNVLAP